MFERFELLLLSGFFAQKVDKQASNSLLRTQIALRVDLGRSIFAEFAKMKVSKRVEFNDLYLIA